MRRFLLASLAILVLLPSMAHAHGLAPLAGTRAATLRAELPSLWCGAQRTTDDTADRLANGAARYHAVLAVPAGQPVRLRALAPDMQETAFEASRLLERDYGRAIRFDLGTDCGPQYLDISVVRLPVDAATLRTLARQETGVLDAVYDALAGAGFPVTRPAEPTAPKRDVNYVVWLDGPGPAGACGQATLYPDTRRAADNRNNLGGSVALLYRQGADFCNGDAVRHEIGHTLGAALPGAAPNADHTGHCVDAYEDTMCAESAPRIAGEGYQGQFFDYGNDDYWDPPKGRPLDWWTVNLSRFLCANPVCNRVKKKAATRARVRAKTRRYART